MKINKKPSEITNLFHEFYKKNPWNSHKFIDIAEKSGFDRNDAKTFLRKEIVHDQLKPEQKFIPIVSKTPGGWQMDTFINEKDTKNEKGEIIAKGLNFLMFINVNTRKAHAYPMKGKGALEVKKALDIFIEDEPGCRSIASDQDAAYLSNQIREWMYNHEINYTTTKDDNHNNLGIINRFMRTIRDMAVKRDFLDDELWDNVDKNGNIKPDFVQTSFISEEQMQELIESYNGAPHRSIGKAPNDFTEKDEQEYIKKHKDTTNPYKFKSGDIVRVVDEKTKLGKKRLNVSHKAYTIDSRKGNLFNVVSNDKSMNEYPGYRLVKAKGKVIMADTLKNGKRGFVQEILEYDEESDKYKVKYEGGVIQWIASKNLREGNPTKLSRMEREYWIKHKPIPPKIRKWF